MQKTTAKVEHRDYVPRGRLAIEFCRVDFYGFRAKEMEKKWKDIKLQRYLKYNSLFEDNETKIQDLRKKANAILNKVRKSKPYYRFWYYKMEKQMISDANELLSQAYKLEEENEEVGKNRFFGTYEYRRKIEDLLQQNGFVLTSTSSMGDWCVTKTEVWTLEE